MKRTICIAAGVFVSTLATTSIASDHLFTAVNAGGLTTQSQPFQNGINNPGRLATTVPGQGSPMSGEDRTTPAVETEHLLTHHRTELNTNANPGNGVLHQPPPAAAGLTVPRSLMATSPSSRGGGH